jgi:hypothetical protein
MAGLRARLAKRSKQTTGGPRQVAEPKTDGGPTKEEVTTKVDPKRQAALAKTSEPPPAERSDTEESDAEYGELQRALAEDSGEVKTGSSDSAIGPDTETRQHDVGPTASEAGPESVAPEPEEREQEPEQDAGDEASLVDRVAAAVVAQIQPKIDALRGELETAKDKITTKMGELAASTIGTETFEEFMGVSVLDPLDKLTAKLGTLEATVGTVEQPEPAQGEAAAIQLTLAERVANMEGQTSGIEDNLGELIEALQEMDALLTKLTGSDGERIDGMVHIFQESTVAVAVEVLRNLSDQNQDSLDIFVNDYGRREWVPEILDYLVNHPDVVKDKVALQKYNVLYEDMSRSDQLAPQKKAVDADAERVICYAAGVLRMLQQEAQQAETGGQ